MTVDPKLDDLFSNDYQLKMVFKGGRYAGLPLIANPKAEFNAQLNFYHRHNETPHWHSRSRDLYALIFSVGMRYRL